MYVLKYPGREGKEVARYATPDEAYFRARQFTSANPDAQIVIRHASKVKAYAQFGNLRVPQECDECEGKGCAWCCWEGAVIGEYVP